MLPERTHALPGVRGRIAESSVERQRAPAGEAVVDAVPPGDLVLAELPAEQHRLAVVQRREVDQAGVEILDLGAVTRDLVDQAGEPPCDGVDLGCRLGELGRRDAAAVAADLLLELLLPLERSGVFLPDAATSCSTSGRTCSSAAFASSGVKCCIAGTLCFAAWTSSRPTRPRPIYVRLAVWTSSSG